MNDQRINIASFLYRKRHIIAIFTGILFIWSCATSVPPDGGRPDTEPPSIIETRPVHGSTNITEREVLFVFSEYVERNSFQQAIHISPLMDVPPKFNWSGKEVTLSFEEELQENKTYVISVGMGVKDVNAGNPMNTSFTLAFSTGDSLDEGIIRGQVYDEDPAEITAFAYQIDNLAPDTLNPATLRPDYAIQTDENGEFILSNLAVGRYRVFAVRDKQNDYVYTIGSDAIGVAEEDTQTGNDSAMVPLRYLLHVEDTTAPYIQSVKIQTSHSLELRISEAPYPVTPELSTISISDSATGALLPVIDIIPVPGKNSTFVVYTGTDFNENTYLVSIDSLQDFVGNKSLTGSNSENVIGSPEPDTLRPEIVAIYPSPNAKDILPDSVFSIHFSRPMSITAGLRMEDSAGVEVPLDAFWKTPHQLVLSHDDLILGMEYSLCVGLSTFVDSLNALSVADSTFCYSFKIIDAEINGSITGSITLGRPGTGPVRVTARKSNGEWTQTTTADKGKYAFPKVPEGKYILNGYVDEDTSGTYTFGKPFPFTPAERFGVSSDTIRVRARWETEGADFTIP